MSTIESSAIYFNTYIAHTLFIFIRLFCPPPIDVLRQSLEMKLVLCFGNSE